MIKLVSENSYEVENFIIKVIGMDSETLSEILPICSDMDQKVKQAMLEISKDEELVEIIGKLGRDENITPAQLVKVTQLSSNSKSDSFSLDECNALIEAFRHCILEVKEKESDEVCTSDFLDEAVKVPKYLKSLGNLIYQEYKLATEVPAAKKI